MRPKTTKIVPLVLALAIAGCGPSTVSPPDTATDEPTMTAPCSSHLTDYCRGWTVKSASPKIKGDHINFEDEIVIGTKSSGADPHLWMFARDPEPKTHWGGQDKVKLTDIESGGSHDCLAGMLKLGGHTSSPPHEWHQITVRLVPLPSSEIEGEKRLELCFTPAENNSPPSSCELKGCPTPDDPRLHGGRAHAQD
jgi:hypothetical protein